VEGTINAGTAVMFAYGGLVAGDLVSGLLSQLLRSRIKVMYIFLALSAVCVFTFLNAGAVSPDTIYVLCGTLGFSVGFWVIFVTIAAEQFGTNLRATVTTTVPNFARGALVFITMLFRWAEGYFGTLQGAMLVGAFCIAISFLFLKGMKETFDEDLNYVEQV